MAPGLLAYVDPTPLIVVANVVFVAAGFFLARSLSRRRRTSLALGLAGGVIVLTLVFWISVALFTGVQRTLVATMEWSRGDGSRHDGMGGPASDHFVLTFRSHPNHFVGGYSDAVVAYLESLPSRDVEAVFEITLDFGRTRGFRLVRLGEHELPAGFGTYVGVRGSSNDSPWP